MDRFFPADKIMMTGNPVRQELLESTIERNDAIRSFGLDPNKKTILVLGGSLGARTINDTFMKGLELVRNTPEVQFILQTGKYYYNEVVAAVKNAGEPGNLYVTDFIKGMSTAYRAADLVISRAGAGSISEFCLLNKPVILVPSPNVAEDHQTKNALALANRDAAIYIKDGEAIEKLIPTAITTVTDDNKLASLSKEIAKLALPSSAEIIADEVIKLAEK
jgi:UDP-N-acetylglucosamine--N-acetylmuramyl-(pentapeptide) pyrophosphoryl-undecaprenol N-acetylglucosamine transferase